MSGQTLIACRKIFNRNRVSLDDEVMERLGVQPGDYITFTSNEEGDIVISKVTV